jgi:hypothetical protein
MEGDFRMLNSPVRASRLWPAALSLVAAIGFASPVLCGADDAPATPPAVSSPEESARQLVEQLGSSSYRQRERATQELGKLGLAAKSALLAGLESSDPEVRLRCQRVLAVVLEMDYQARLLAFIADRDGTGQHDLPGWQRYRRMFGDDAVSRGLFVDMQRAEPGLMEAIEVGPQAAGDALEARGQQIQSSLFNTPFGDRKQPPLGSLAALFFAAADPEVPISDLMIGYMGNYTYQNTFQMALSSGPRVELLRKLLGAWVARSVNTSGAFQGLVLALRHELREGLEPALSMVRGGGVQAQIMQYALLVVGKFGDEQHLDAIEPLLSNTTTCLTYQVNNEEFRTEVRDVALAMLVHLSKQDLKEYGFVRAQPNDQLLFNPASLGFRDSDDRYTGIDKWKAWSAARK